MSTDIDRLAQVKLINIYQTIGNGILGTLGCDCCVEAFGEATEKRLEECTVPSIMTKQSRDGCSF